MRSIWPAIRSWFTDHTTLTPLAICRIGYGFTLFSAYLIRVPWLHELYGDFRIHPTQISDTLPMGLSIEVPYYGLLTSSVLFALGFWTRTTGLITLLLHSFLHNRAPLATWGWSAFIRPLLVYVILGKSGNVLSLDSWVAARKGKPLPKQGPAFALRLIQIFMALMYFSTGTSHLLNSTWRSGDLVYLALMHRMTTRFDFDWSPLRPVLAFFTYFSLVFELAAPLLLWFRQIGPWVAVGLFLMHLGVDLLMTMDWWSAVMMTSLVVFIPEAWLKSLSRVIRISNKPPRRHASSR